MNKLIETLNKYPLVQSDFKNWYNETPYSKECSFISFCNLGYIFQITIFMEYFGSHNLYFVIDLDHANNRDLFQEHVEFLQEYFSKNKN